MNTLDALILATYSIKIYVIESTIFVAASTFTINDSHGNNKAVHLFVNRATVLESLYLKRQI